MIGPQYNLNGSCVTSSRSDYIVKTIQCQQCHTSWHMHCTERTTPIATRTWTCRKCLPIAKPVSRSSKSALIALRLQQLEEERAILQREREAERRSLDQERRTLHEKYKLLEHQLELRRKGTYHIRVDIQPSLRPECVERPVWCAVDTSHVIERDLFNHAETELTHIKEHRLIHSSFGQLHLNGIQQHKTSAFPQTDPKIYSLATENNPICFGSTTLTLVNVIQLDIKSSRRDNIRTQLSTVIPTQRIPRDIFCLANLIASQVLLSKLSMIPSIGFQLRPEVLMKVSLGRIRSVPTSKSRKTKLLIEFVSGVNLLCNQTKAAGQDYHSINLQPLMDSVGRLPRYVEAKWTNCLQNYWKVKFEIVVSSINELVEFASTVAPYTNEFSGVCFTDMNVCAGRLNNTGKSNLEKREQNEPGDVCKERGRLFRRRGRIKALSIDNRCETGLICKRVFSSWNPAQETVRMQIYVTTVNMKSPAVQCFDGNVLKLFQTHSREEFGREAVSSFTVSCNTRYVRA
ncbi:uncharacterized protein LOC134215469 [Armigeres subalbatus]|uniref:uncharacterized protein LOC134215469 n=1 Tax=Armigeres subalbatus TaxID=124917 RepID=UPI002ED06C3D